MSAHLFLDTTEKSALVGLIFNEGKSIQRRICDKEKLTDNLLLEIDKLLMDFKIEKKDLKSIFINKGPGSYTGLRIGITTANFLAYSLNIPVYTYKGKLAERPSIRISNKPFQGPAFAYYKNDPHITKSKYCYK